MKGGSRRAPIKLSIQLYSVTAVRQGFATRPPTPTSSPHTSNPPIRSVCSPPPSPTHTMLAFAPTSSVAAAKPSLTTSFMSAPVCYRHAATHSVPAMILRTSLRKPVGSAAAFVGMASGFGGAAAILAKADTYMAQSIFMQYYKVANPAGVYGVQCTEGDSKHMAVFSRACALNAHFRARQAFTAQALLRNYVTTALRGVAQLAPTSRPRSRSRTISL